MKEQFVTYEIALKLKEKGFDESCLAWYFPKSKTEYELRGCGAIIFGLDGLSRFDNGIIAAPLWQQAINWLDKKEIFCSAEMRIEDGLFKWYPVFKTVVDYEEVKVELSPRGTKQNALIDIITHALTLI